MVDGMLKFKNDINWNVSGAFSHDDILLYSYDFTRKLIGGKLFNSVHGSCPCKFNSGRRGVSCSLEYIKNCIEEYHSRDINVFYTFSNFLLEKTDLDDEFCNNLLMLLKDGDGVILSSKVLYDYVKRKFPHLLVISSVLNAVNHKGNRGVEFYQYNMSLYDRVVLHPDDNHEASIVENLPEKRKIEILINERCIAYCQYRFKHDLLLCKESLCPNIDASNACDEFSRKYCVGYDEYKMMKLMLDNSGNRTDRLTIEEISRLIDLGYTNFKIQGRGDTPASFVYDLAKYLISEQYRDLFFNAIVKNFSFNSKKDRLNLYKL